MAVAQQQPDPEQHSDQPAIPHIRPVEMSRPEDQTPSQGPIRRVLSVLGPGVVTGASDDDPSGIGTYAVTGAQFGYGLLWTAPWSYPLMASVQFICAKVGMVSGMGLSGVLRQHYPRWVLYPALALLLIANTVNAGADIEAIAAAINLLLPVPILVMIIPITLAILALQIFADYRLISGVFKWLTIALFAYIGAGILARPDLGDVLKNSVIPHIEWSGAFATTLVAILGTTISPYLFFWQASQEVEEEIEQGRHRLWQRRGATNDELKYRAWDVNIGMGIAIVVMFFIMLSTAATLHQSGQTQIASAADAAQALRPLAGDMAYLLLALGLVGTGVLAVPILTGSAAYAVAEAMGWKYGLSKKVGNAKAFYGVIVVATLVGMGLNFLNINPMTALFYSAVINGLLAPPLLLLIMLISNRSDIMGRRTNNRWTNLAGWATTAIMSVAAVVLIATWVTGQAG